MAVFKAGNVFAQEVVDLLDLLPALNLGLRQVEGVHRAELGDPGHIDAVFPRGVGLEAQNRIPVDVEFSRVLGRLNLAERAGDIVVL